MGMVSYWNFLVNERDDDSEQRAKAGAALLVYVTIKSADWKKLRDIPKNPWQKWEYIESQIPNAATRADDLWDFYETFKQKVACRTINSRHIKTVDDDIVAMKIDHETGEIIQMQDKGKRQFLVEALAEVDHERAIELLRYKSGLIVQMVRDRLERERKYIETKGGTQGEEITIDLI